MNDIVDMKRTRRGFAVLDAEDGKPIMELPGLRWERQWISRVGCVKSCLNYLGIEVSMPWLYGATGYAFILNVHEGLCPSGWFLADVPFGKLGENVGFEVDHLAGYRPHDDPNAARRAMWDGARRAIDAGLPCYSLDLKMGEYYVVYGYDEIGYYYSGPSCDEGEDPLPWREIGTTGVADVLLMDVVRPGGTANDVTTVREALQYAVAHARSEGSTNGRYAAGLNGYARWIRALETGRADGYGAAYNAQCYLECRRAAAVFLREAQIWVDDEDGSPLSVLFEGAIGQYDRVAAYLEHVAEALPYSGHRPEHITDGARRSAAVEALKAAREAEDVGVSILEQIAGQL